MVLKFTIKNYSSIHFVLFSHFFSIIAPSLLIHGWSPRHGRWLIEAIPLNIGIAGIDLSEKLEKITDHTHLTASLPLKLAYRKKKKKFYHRPLSSTRGFLCTKHLRVYTLMNRLNEIFIGKIGWSQKLSTRRANPRKITGGWGRRGIICPLFGSLIFYSAKQERIKRY